jgi:hypothetical protein
MNQKLTNHEPKFPLLITVQEAGRRLGMKPGTIKKRLEQRNFPIPVRKQGRNWMCCAADVPAYVEKLFDKAQPPANDPSFSPADGEKLKRGPGRPRKGAPA